MDSVTPASTIGPQAQNVPVAAIPQVSQVIYAGFWRRFVAKIIDWAILGASGFILDIILNLIFPSKQGLTYNIVYFCVGILEFLAYWLYAAILESSSKQATIGKRLIGIKVTNLQGEKISFARATGRYFATVVAYLVGIVTAGLGLIVWFGLAGWTPKKQAVHDMIASTLVVKT